MLRINTMDSRPGATAYLTRQMGCEDRLDREEQELAKAAQRGDAVEYFEKAERDGEAPGRWRGRGAEMLGFSPGELANADQVRTVLGELRDPQTGDRLGQEPKSFESRQERFQKWIQENPHATEEDRIQEWNRIVDTQRSAVAFYDLTFSAQKTVSVYHAALEQSGRHELANAVLRAHRTAVGAALGYLEREATWTRTGGHRRTVDGTTGSFEKVNNVVAVEFDHSTSRAQDPHLHTHCAVLNRVKCEDGQWRAIHGAAWRKTKATIASIYERVLADEIEAATPARFAAREDGMGREILGIDDEVLAASSRRSRQVEAAQREAEQRFRAEHGRAPTARELHRIHRMAGLSSRASKSHRSPDQQLKDWAELFDTDKIVRDVAASGRDVDWHGRPDEQARPDPMDRSAVIFAALHEVQARTATWLPGELRAEIERQLPTRLTGVDDVQSYIDELTTTALRDQTYGVVDVSRPEPLPVPGWWREADGRPQWRDPAAGRYTTRTQLDMERELVVTARQHRGGALPAAELRDAEAELRTRGLSEGQINAVLGVLGSDRHADALVSAAGTGKSFTVGQLADQWERRTGGRVLGLATSQIASEVLVADGLDAINTTKFLGAYEADPRTGVPRERLGHRDLLVVDESNMSSTQELARIQRIAAAAGAKLLYTGDPRQLQAVGAGGALGLIARENGVFELEQVHRFVEDWEKKASLRLREGDLDVLEEYDRHGRINSGTQEEMRRRAVLNYVHDVAIKGLSSVLVTATNPEAAEVSAVVQDKLRVHGMVGHHWVVDRLGDGNHACRGDLVQARKNDWHVETSGEVAGVVNRGRYRVIGWEKPFVTDPDNRLVVELEDGSGRVKLPRAYVEEHLVLGYAGTEHACEGLSVDTGHALTAGYVAMTRGKTSNIAYVTTEEPGDHHGPGVDATAREILAERFVANAEELTAVEERRRAAAQATDMSTLVGIWDHTDRELSDYRHSDMIVNALGNDLADRIQMESGAPRLYQVLREAEAYGHNAEHLLANAISERSLDRVDDLAAVLRSRIERKLDRTDVAEHSWTGRTQAITGPLGEFQRELAGLMDARERELGRVAAEQQPEWAIEQLGPAPDPSDQQQREEWERRAARIGAWRETIGTPETNLDLGAKPQGWLDQLLWQRAVHASGLDLDSLDYRQADESTLRSWISRADRAASWAPEYVAQDLGTARRLEHRHQSEAALATARAEAALDEAEREQALADAERSTRLAQRMRIRVSQLDELHKVRTQWLQSTAEIRHRAEQARAEIARRGLDQRESQAEAEQTELFDAAVALRPDLDAEHVEQVRQLANDHAAAAAEQRLAEHLHGTDIKQQEEAQQEVKDEAQLELFSDAELQNGNDRALATVETVHAPEEELEQSAEQPLIADDSVREALRRAEYAQEMLDRQVQRQRAEQEALDEEFDQRQAQQDAEREAQRDAERAEQQEFEFKL
ncbi:MobF family relaxase [Saccharopolyspora sp. NPDC000359]|uniref:MobF family relaxase n=1 Tax=Saccharopolyspora sp. NPDC000359 TaxID=3154251 RepID=UPI00332E021F